MMRKLINPYRRYNIIPLPEALLEVISIEQAVLYGILAKYAGKDGFCFPQQTTLAKQLRVSVSTIKRWLKQLQKAELIDICQASGHERLMHRSNRYFFLDHPVFGDSHFDTCGSGTRDTSGKHPGDTSLDRSPVTSPTERESYKENHIKKNNSSITRSKEMSCYMAERILQRDEKYFHLVNGKKEKTIERWSVDFQKLHAVDKREWPEIESVLEWTLEDDFWSKNILSGKKFREKFSDLLLKMPAKSKKGSSQFITGKRIL